MFLDTRLGNTRPRKLNAHLAVLYLFPLQKREIPETKKTTRDDSRRPSDLDPQPSEAAIGNVLSLKPPTSTIM